MSKINNAANYPIFFKAGTVPDLSDALLDYYQHMTFVHVGKINIAFQAFERPIPINFRGVIQPYSERQLLLLPQGERAWTWFTIHSDPTLKLQVDDVVDYLGVQTRIMSRKDFTLYGYVEYTAVQDWTGAGP